MRDAHFFIPPPITQEFRIFAELAQDICANAGLTSVLKIAMISELRQEAAHHDVRKLRNLYIHGRMTHAEIANALGVGRSTITETMKRLGISPIKRRARQSVAGRGLPYGMNAADGSISSSPEEARAIELMVELRRRGRSYRVIAQKLNETGIPTKTGLRLWAASTVMGILKRTGDLSRTR